MRKYISKCARSVVAVAISASGGDAVVGDDVDDGRSPAAAGDERDVPGSGALLVATGTDLDGIRTFLNPPVPKLCEKSRGLER